MYISEEIGFFLPNDVKSRNAPLPETVYYCISQHFECVKDGNGV